MVVQARYSPQTCPAQEGAVGEVIAFGLPPLRVRRNRTNGFCEVTVLPARVGDVRDVRVSPRSPKRWIFRKPSGAPRPIGAGLK